MNEVAISKAIIPTPWTILGLKLRPFSLGHFILLHRVESAFILGGEITYDDLATAVLICSQTFEEAIESFQDPDLPRVMEKWAKKLLKRGPIDLEAKANEFLAYLNEGRLTEDDLFFSYDPQSTRSSSLPTVHAVRVRVQGHYGMTDSEILNRGWWLCYLDDHIIKDMAGIIELQDKKEIDDAREVANRLQEKLNKGEIQWPHG